MSIIKNKNKMYMNILNWFQKSNNIGFDDILQNVINKKKGKILLINTLPITEQDYLIINTVPCNNEESLINDIIKQSEEIYYTIIIYGKNVLDETTKIKYNQLNNLGFQSVYIYSGGLFEWSLLAEIYGQDNFRTTHTCIDILKLSPQKILPNDDIKINNNK
jgi:hypothetical protein